MRTITTVAELEACYPGPAVPASIIKEVDRLTPHYRALIGASPFVVLATSGPEGLDCSPRGDSAGFVRIVDDRTLVLPDRRGNNRLDSLRNVLSDSRVSLLFLIPGSGTTLRVNGHAAISADATLLAGFGGGHDAARTALVITVQTAYFQCPRSVTKAGLWDPATWSDPDRLPSQMDMLEAFASARAPERVLEPA